MDYTEAEHFRRIQVMHKIERAADIISRYRDGIDFYRDKIERYCTTLGHIAERLGDPEPKEEN